MTWDMIVCIGIYVHACIVMPDVDVSVYKFLYDILRRKNFDNYSNTFKST